MVAANAALAAGREIIIRAALATRGDVQKALDLLGYKGKPRSTRYYALTRFQLTVPELQAFAFKTDEDARRAARLWKEHVGEEIPSPGSRLFPAGTDIATFVDELKELTERDRKRSKRNMR